jgi:hypothetical protein
MNTFQKILDNTLTSNKCNLFANILNASHWQFNIFEFELEQNISVKQLLSQYFILKRYFILQLQLFSNLWTINLQRISSIKTYLLGLIIFLTFRR